MIKVNGNWPRPNVLSRRWGTSPVGRDLCPYSNEKQGTGKIGLSHVSHKVLEGSALLLSMCCVSMESLWALEWASLNGVQFTNKLNHPLVAKLLVPIGKPFSAHSSPGGRQWWLVITSDTKYFNKWAWGTVSTLIFSELGQWRARKA